MKCDACGAPVENGKCTYCGKVFPNVQPNENNRNPEPIIHNTIIYNQVSQQNGRKKNKIIALLLCIFFGYFGAHKFYEGKIIMGVIYLFTLGLFGFGWIVDIILIALKPNPYYV